MDASNAYREIKVSLGRECVTLRATPSVLAEVQRLVADPLLITRELFLDDYALAAQQFGHRPRFQFSITNIPEFLHIGAVAAGSELTLSDIENLTFACGYVEAKNRALEFLALLLGPSPAPHQSALTSTMLLKPH